MGQKEHERKQRAGSEGENVKERDGEVTHSEDECMWLPSASIPVKCNQVSMGNGRGITHCSTFSFCIKF